jgi:membrane protein DedA with SNARE-associated domain
MGGNLATWITDIMNTLGYAGIAFLMFAENLFPPIPSELIMPLAGFNISQGNMGWAGAIAAGTLGTIAGALPWYYIGKVFNEKRLGAWCDRYGKWLGLSSADIRTSIVWFNRHGTKAVFFGRLVPGIRTLISLPAGIEGMALPKFLLYSTIGTALWVTFLTAFGYVLGENYSKVEQYIGPLSKIALASLLLAFVVFWVRKQLRRGDIGGGDG